jgi:hypothetical protein
MAQHGSKTVEPRHRGPSQFRRAPKSACCLVNGNFGCNKKQLLCMVGKYLYTECVHKRILKGANLTTQIVHGGGREERPSLSVLLPRRDRLLLARGKTVFLGGVQCVTTVTIRSFFIQKGTRLFIIAPEGAALLHLSPQLDRLTTHITSNYAIHPLCLSCNGKISLSSHKPSRGCLFLARALVHSSPKLRRVSRPSSSA